MHTTPSRPSHSRPRTTILNPRTGSFPLLSKQRDFQGRWDWMNWIFVGHRPGLRVSAIPTSGHRVGRASIIAYWRDLPPPSHHSWLSKLGPAGGSPPPRSKKNSPRGRKTPHFTSSVGGPGDHLTSLCLPTLRTVRSCNVWPTLPRPRRSHSTFRF